MRQRPYLLLLLPAFSVVVLVVAAPLLFSLYSSFTAYRLTRPSSLFVWIGLTNYRSLALDASFWWAFARTLLFLTVALNLELLCGLGLALAVRQVTHGQRLLRTILMFPMMFCPVLVGFQFKFLLNDNIGLVNALIQHVLGLNVATPWLVDGVLAFISIATAELWNSTSVFAVLLLAGLMAMPTEPLDAAKVDGCTAWQTLRHVTLPYLMPFVWIAMTIRSLDVGRAYDIVKIMTNGGPGERTELLWTLTARVGFDDGRMGLANAMSYVAIVVSIAFTLYFFKKLSAARQFME